MMQQEPEDELERMPPRPPAPPPGFSQPPQPPGPAAGPPDVLHAVTRLSQPPAPGADPYVLAPPPGAAPTPAGPATQDRVLAALAHGAILFGFLGIGFLLALGINLVIWIASRRSPYVAYHARQA